jgi:hypothetical protein
VVAVDVAPLATILVALLVAPIALLIAIVRVPAVVTEAATVEFGKVILLPDIAVTV